MLGWQIDPRKRRLADQRFQDRLQRCTHADQRSRLPTVNGIDFQRSRYQHLGVASRTPASPVREHRPASRSRAVSSVQTVRPTAAASRTRRIRSASSTACNWIKGDHNVKFGGEVRLIRLYTDRLGGTTYTFSNLNDFLANTLASVQYLGDVSAAEPVQRRSRRRQAREAGILHRLRTGRMEDPSRPDAELRFAVRVLRAAPRGRMISRSCSTSTTGTLRPASESAYQVVEEQFRPAGRDDVVAKSRPATGFFARRQDGVPRRLWHLLRPGPDRGPDPADRKRPHQFDDHERRAARVSGEHGGDRRQTSTRIRTTAAISRVRTRTITRSRNGLSVHVLVAAAVPRKFTSTVAYVGSQGRNLFLRSVANQILPGNDHPRRDNIPDGRRRRQSR